MGGADAGRGGLTNPSTLPGRTPTSSALGVGVTLGAIQASSPRGRFICMEIIRKTLVAAGLIVALTACGSATSDEPATTTTAQAGQSIGFGDAIDRTREVAQLAEDRADLIDQMAP